MRRQIPRMGTLAVPAKGGWRRRLCGLGAMAGMLILWLLVSANLGMSADWWRQGTVWKKFNHEQKLMYLQGYSAGFLAGAQQAFKNPDGLKDFYKSLAKMSFRQGEVIISRYLKNNPHKMSEPLGNLIFAAYNEAAKGASKAPEQVIAAKSAPKPPETPVARNVPKAPEKVLRLKMSRKLLKRFQRLRRSPKTLKKSTSAPPGRPSSRNLQGRSRK